MGGRSDRRSFVSVLQITILNVAAAVPFIQIFFVHCPALIDGLHHVPRFGGVPTCTSGGMFCGVCFLSVMSDFSIVSPSDVSLNKNQ